MLKCGTHLYNLHVQFWDVCFYPRILIISCSLISIIILFSVWCSDCARLMPTRGTCLYLQDQLSGTFNKHLKYRETTYYSLQNIKCSGKITWLEDEISFWSRLFSRAMFVSGRVRYCIGWSNQEPSPNCNQVALILWWPVSSVICKYLMCWANDASVTQECPVWLQLFTVVTIH